MGELYAPTMTDNLEVRRQLATAIRERVRNEGWTQAQAAEILGLTQPRTSLLLNLQVEKFSIDALVNLLDPLGMKLDIWLT